MPLVTRTSNQGNFFQQDEEPPNWSNADLWADTNLSPRGLFINNDGTALQLGSASVTTAETQLNAELAPTAITRALTNTTGTTLVAADVTPTTGTNNIVIAGYGSGYGSIAGGITVALNEGVTTLVSDTASGSIGAVVGQMLITTETDVSVAAHTYDVEVTGNASRNACGLGISTTLIE